MHTVSLRYTSCWFDTFIDCKMITSTVLANTAITSHIYWLCVCVCVWWEHLRSVFLVTFRGFPGGARGKVRAWQGGDLRSGFNPGVRKIPWRRNWQPTSVFLSEKSHGQRVQEGYSSWGCKEWDTPEHTHMIQSVNLMHVSPIVLLMSFIAKERKTVVYN